MVSKIKVDEIESSQSGGSVDLNSSLSFVSKTTTEMNALTGMAAGDTIYNSSVGTLYVYNGTGWHAMSNSTFGTTVSYLVIAGGGSGGYSDGGHDASGGGGGGGAGGYRNSYDTESSGGSTTETPLLVPSELELL